MQPLADVRVLAIEQFGAGPWGTLQLADLGADVIKIEDPASRGDVGRYVPPFAEGEDSLFFETFNRNKRSISLDLRHPEARGVFEDLVRGSDVVYSNLRGDQPAKLRLTYEDLKDVNPRIVCCSLSGFGTTGPRAAQGGYDYMMQGLAGWMSLTGDPDGPPTKSGLSLVDLSGGYASAIAVLAGLWRARRDGTGCDCDVSLLDTALHELMYVGTWTASRGLHAAAAEELRPPLDRPVPELRDRGRLDRRRLSEGEVLDAAVRRDRPSGPGRGVSDLRRPRPPPRRALADPRRGVPRTDERGVARSAEPGGRPLLAGERRRRLRSRRPGSSSTSIRGWARCARSPRRCGCPGPEPPVAARACPRRAHGAGPGRGVRLRAGADSRPGRVRCVRSRAERRPRCRGKRCNLRAAGSQAAVLAGGGVGRDGLHGRPDRRGRRREPGRGRNRRADAADARERPRRAWRRRAARWTTSSR